MNTQLTQAFLAQRSAASSAVAGALAPKATAKAAGATGTSTASSNSTSTITSSDFLTLLVSELKNQDPTQPTDPNQYITQLAQVNSLEQLISINTGIQTLDSAVPAKATAPISGTGVTVTGDSTPATGATHPAFTPALTTSAASQIRKPSQGVAAQ